MSAQSDHGCVDGKTWATVVAEDGENSLAHVRCLTCEARAIAEWWRHEAFLNFGRYPANLYGDFAKDKPFPWEVTA